MVVSMVMDGRATHNPHKIRYHRHRHTYIPSQASLSAPSPTGRAPWPPPAPPHFLPPGAAPAAAAGAAAAAAPPPRRPVWTIEDDRSSQYGVRRSIELGTNSRRSSAARVRRNVRATRGPAVSGASGRSRRTPRAPAAASCAVRIECVNEWVTCLDQADHGVCGATMCVHVTCCVQIASPDGHGGLKWRPGDTTLQFQAIGSLDSIKSYMSSGCVASMPDPHDSPCRPVVMGALVSCCPSAR